jgi:hypothetical protein
MSETAYDKTSPQLQVLGTRVYYVWCENDGSYDQIWTAMLNLDLTDLKALERKRTSGAFDKKYPQLQSHGEKIHYIWSQDDGSNSQIWTAVGSSFSPGAFIPMLLND